MLFCGITFRRCTNLYSNKVHAALKYVLLPLPILPRAKRLKSGYATDSLKFKPQSRRAHYRRMVIARDATSPTHRRRRRRSAAPGDGAHALVARSSLCRRRDRPARTRPRAKAIGTRHERTLRLCRRGQLYSATVPIALRNQ
jgi:hypothetical protein